MDLRVMPLDGDSARSLLRYSVLGHLGYPFRPSMHGRGLIDATTASVISLADATNELSRLRAGRKAHVSCLYRWSTSGLQGVVLETIQVGGTRCTSREALQRFFEALSQPRQADSTA